MKKRLKPVVVLIISVLATGCQSIAYYSQAVGGQMDIWSKQRDIAVVLDDPQVDPETKQRLRAALQARKFASSQLALPDNRSYSRYADLGRDTVVWNVVATPPYAVDAIKSCFPVVGCVSYRGYYKKQAALQRAKKYQQAGLDVYVAGVTAYSTLGWFDDPLLNTMLARSDAAIASLIFHELAHQVVFVKGDTRFNESFATAVEQIGLRQWARARDSDPGLEAYFSNWDKRRQVIALVLDAREKMRRSYLAYHSAGEARLAARKHELFQDLKRRYVSLSRAGGGTPGFERFFAGELNNASLAMFGEYHGWVEAFTRLFHAQGSDWKRFYGAVKALSRFPQQERDQRLALLSVSNPS